MALCIPNYGWVPGVSGPPDWYSGAGSMNTSLRDPRWVSALRLSVDAGAGEKFTIRAVRRSSPDQLSLSVLVQETATGSLSTSDYLYIGFNPGTATNATILRLEYTETDEEEAATTFTIQAFNWNGSSWASSGTPAWVTQTRVWRSLSPDPSWAFQMVIDLAAANLTNAGNPDFGMCFQARVQAPPMEIRYRYPATMPLITGSLGASGLNPGTAGHWQDFAFAGAGATCDPGVWIDASRIGTTNTPTHQMNINSNNTFRAEPRNDSSSPAQIRARFRLANWGSAPEQAWRDLMVTPAGTVAASSDGLLTENWQPQSTANVQLPGGGTQNEVAFYTAHKHQCMLVELEAVSGTVYFSKSSVARNMDFVTASKFTRAAEISVRGLNDGYPKARRDVYIFVERQNVPVKMDAATRRKYAWVREMYSSISNIAEGFSEEQRFVAIIAGDLRHLRYINIDNFIEWTRSAFAEEQLILQGRFFDLLRPFGIDIENALQLIDQFADEARQYHETLEYDEDGQPIFEQPLIRQIIQLILDNIVYRGPVTAPYIPPPSAEELEQYMPTVRYHVFRDTGQRNTVNGVVYPVVEPQASFGYYVWLDHDVQQWELRLQNAERVGENLYLLRPPAHGEARVNTVVHAVAEGEQDQIEPPEPIVAPPEYKPDIRDEDGGVTPTPDGCLEMIARALESLGPVGKSLAQIVRSLASRSTTT
jgi:hypothetical protein